MTQPALTCTRRRGCRLLAGLLAGCGAWPLPARPQQRRIHLTVAYPPGGVSDDTARDLARRLEPRVGVPVLVDHRPGAGGVIALETLARSPADGSALAFAAIMPLLQMSLASSHGDPLQRVAPVAAVMETPVLIVATPAFAGRSIDDLVVAARREPGRIRWATSGLSTTGHLVLERLAAHAAIEITHVPYAGGGRQLLDALAGQFEILSTNVAERQLAYLRDGRFHALAVGAAERLAVLPEVPTLHEAGHAAANLSSLFGVFAPAATPDRTLDLLNRQINAVLAEPGFRARLSANHNLPAAGSRQQFAQRIEAALAQLERRGGR